MSLNLLPILLHWSSDLSCATVGAVHTPRMAARITLPTSVFASFPEPSPCCMQSGIARACHHTCRSSRRRFCLHPRFPPFSSRFITAPGAPIRTPRSSTGAGYAPTSAHRSSGSCRVPCKPARSVSAAGLLGPTVPDFSHTVTLRLSQMSYLGCCCLGVPPTFLLSAVRSFPRFMS
ncbi:hypothetical protein BD626DRAFT_488070 [Schizophyllum amplum]|uniref:Secreted protein n=1 Tax=Schizophyllum amplum TaxID=97359 RepID=A0A550CKA2_9AGAR|nr:hypothetical protein BD626DRAFT_488070 [Auriculariopsis ampla]